MTFGDHDSIDDDILLLRADARSGVPQGARDRVLKRLGLGVGAIGAATTVSAGAGAITGALATSSTKILVTTLALGIGIGFGTRSGLDVLGGAPPPRDEGRSVASATKAASPRALGPRRPAEPAPTPPETRVAPATTTTTDTVEAPPSKARPQPSPARAPVTAAMPAFSVPAPVLVPPSLAEQQALLDDARGALVRRDGASALSAIGAHRLRFPNTTLAEERAALEIRALVELGRLDEARERHAAFDLAFPGSLFANALRTLLPSTAPDPVTEPAPSLQEDG